ncbi:MAG: hypothetical protein IPO83_04485 [Chitinophagaceae bacterium]|nr:hypothetical protein [Chitinophagaceae bacterium]
MKNIAFFLLTIVILNSCRKDSNDFLVGVDVQSSFNHDEVKIFIDGKKLIDKELQTFEVLGVCYGDGQIITSKNKGNHKIKVIVNNGTTVTENFSLDADLYIGINYNQQTKEISFVYAAQRFIYD